MLSLYKALLDLRRREPALSVGSYTPLASAPGVLAFQREYDGRVLTVLLNLTQEPKVLELPDQLRGASLLLASDAVDNPKSAPASFERSAMCELPPDTAYILARREASNGT
jgi:glycosidase